MNTPYNNELSIKRKIKSANDQEVSGRAGSMRAMVCASARSEQKGGATQADISDRDGESSNVPGGIFPNQ